MTATSKSDRPGYRQYSTLATLLLLAGMAAPALAADLAGTGSAAARQLADAEDQIFQAKIHKDFAALARGFADEALYVHTPGVTQNRAEHIELIRNGRLDYRSIATEDRVVRVFGDVGITRGRIIQTVGERNHTEGYLAVYIKRDGRWQMLDWRTSPIPGQGGNRNGAAAQPAPADAAAK